MDYFLSHLPQIFIAALVVSGAAILWSYSLELAARRKRERQEKRRAEALQNSQASSSENIEALEDMQDDSDDQWRMLR